MVMGSVQFKMVSGVQKSPYIYSTPLLASFPSIVFEIVAVKEITQSMNSEHFSYTEKQIWRWIPVDRLVVLLMS